MPASPAPPRPGLTEGAPWAPVKHLWAVAEAADVAGLREALAHLAPALTAAPWAELRVRYGPGLQTPEAARLHAEALAATGAHGAAPYCLSPAPGQRAAAAAVATPPDCAGCLLYQPGRCPGLGQAAIPWIDPDAPPPFLRAADAWATLGADAFADSHPVACWRPTGADIARIAAAARRAGGRVVDLGGGNGLFSALLAAQGLHVTLVDPNGNGPTPPGVRRVVASAQAVAGGAAGAELAADVVLVSWPPTGDGFRAAVEALSPAVVVFAYDAEGLCGRRPGHAGLVATPEGLTAYRWPIADDFAPWPSRPLQARWAVPSYRALTQGQPTLDGVVEIHAPWPVPPPPSAPRLPWEPAP